MAEPSSPPLRYTSSPSRRRRSSGSDHEPGSFKFRRTGTRLEVLPYRWKSEAEQLCQQCASIDLARIISSQSQISPKGHFVMYLEWDERGTCRLCDFFRNKRIPALAREISSGMRDKNTEDKRQGYHLRAFSGMLSYREYFFRAPQHQRRRSGDTMLAVVPNGLFSDQKNDRQESYTRTFGHIGYILPIAHTSTAPWLTGRRVHPFRVDFPAVQGWLQFCRKNHRCSMRYSRPDKLSVIDCKDMKIVAAPPNCNYFALSYVWGATASTVPEQRIGLTEALEDLAPVVRDAIRVVKSLGWRYLWVDRYCIPQTDVELKSEHIQRMDLIYEGAFCTIVAAAGVNDQHGLPGISCRRQAQPSFDVGHDSYVSTLPDAQKTILESKWMTRAWTYQEALCSARRLIFTEYQVYYECKVMHCCEAIEIPLNHLHTADRKDTQPWIRPILFRDEWLQGTHRFGPLSAYWSVVKQYSKRRMTYDSDALNALNGILRRFQASPSFVHNIFGIPLHSDPKDGKEALLDPTLFVSGLSWPHIDAPRRRNHFPSWTWAGWEGAIELQHTFGGTRYESAINLSVEEKNGERTPWARFWDEFWLAERKSQCFSGFSCLVLEGDVFKVQLIMRETRHADDSPRFEMVNPYNGSKLASIVLPRDMHDSARVKDDLWDCVILGRKARSGGTDVMLIRWRSDVAERIWAGTLFSRGRDGTIDAQLPPVLKKTFKLM